MKNMCKRTRDEVILKWGVMKCHTFSLELATKAKAREMVDQEGVSGLSTLSQM
jgi:hypothetical protein